MLHPGLKAFHKCYVTLVIYTLEVQSKLQVKAGHIAIRVAVHIPHHQPVVYLYRYPTPISWIISSNGEVGPFCFIGAFHATKRSEVISAAINYSLAG